MESDGGNTDDRPSTTLTPSGLGQYISYSGCPRFFRLKYFDQDIVDERNWYDPISHSDLFAELGLAYEEQQLATLAENSELLIGDKESDGNPVSYDAVWPAAVETDSGKQHEDIQTRWEQAIHEQLHRLIERLAKQDPSDLDGPVVLFQTPMYGRIGVWDIAGIADLITLKPLPDSYGIRSRILEVKTSWKDKTSHQKNLVER
jgi:hypothetical protein